MNVLLINSSYRKSGNTAAALSCLGGELAAGGAVVREINLAHMEIGTCRGCRICFDRGESMCPLRDDVEKIADAIRSSDAVVFASPIYVEDVNGVMKNWIDRMAYNCHRPAFHGKVAFVLTTSGVGSSNHGRTTVGRALQTWGFASAGSSKYATGASMSRESFAAKYSAAVKKDSAKIIRSLRVPRSPSLMSVLTYEIQKAYFARAGVQDSCDHRYWSDRGWLDASRRFYTDVRVSTLKSALARALAPAISSLVLR